jgi:hypothetical protein
MVKAGTLLELRDEQHEVALFRLGCRKHVQMIRHEAERSYFEPLSRIVGPASAGPDECHASRAG